LRRPEKLGSMEIERETLVEIVTSVGAVLLFVVVLFAIGVLFNDNGFSQSGALALVGAIIGFILLMSGVAFFLSSR
jgi:hypothetical protein